MTYEEQRASALERVKQLSSKDATKPSRDAFGLNKTSPDVTGTVTEIDKNIDSFLDERRAKKKAEFIEKNIMDGVVLDTQTGMGSIERMWGSFRKEYPKQELRFWQNKYPEGNVRRATDGGIIIRVEEDGQKVDRLVDEQDLTFADVGELAATGTEIAGNIAGALAVRKIPALKAGGKVKQLARFIATGAGSAVAGQGVGAATDMATIAQDIGIEGYNTETLSDIAKTRGTLAAVDTVLDLGLAAGISTAGRALSRTVDPFQFQKRAQSQAITGANQRLKERYGKEVPLTASEVLRDPTSPALFGFYANVPGGQIPAAKFQQYQSEIANEIQRSIMGLKNGQNPLPDEMVYDNAYGVLRKYMDDIPKEIDVAQDQLYRLASQKIANEFDSKTIGKRTLENIPAYAALFQKSMQRSRKAFWIKNDQLYGEVASNPEYEQKLFGHTGLAKKAKDIKDNLPNKDYVSIEETGLTDAAGKPITTETLETRPLSAFIPNELRTFLDDIISLDGQKQSLNQMVQMRRALYDRIDEGEAIPGLATHQLTALADEITKEISRVSSALPGGKFKADLTKANAYYAQEVGKFKDKHVKGLFLPENHPGSASPISYFTTIQQNPDAYFAVKKVLGESSPDLKTLQKGVLDEYLSKSMAVNIDGETIDGDVLHRLLRGGSRKEKAVIHDILGPKLSRNLAQAISETGFAKSRGVDLPRDVRINIDKLLRQQGEGKEPSLAQIRKMINLNNKQSKLYENKIIQDVVGRNPTDRQASVKPSEFVQTFMHKSSHKDFKDVWDNIVLQDPATAEMVRVKAIEDVFRQASKAKSPEELMGDLRFGKAGDPLDGKALRGQHLTESAKSNLKSVVGDEIMRDIEAMAFIQENITHVDQMGKIAGGLVRGSIYAEMVNKPLSSIGKSARFYLVSALAHSPVARMAAEGFPKTSEGIRQASKVMTLAFLSSPSGQRALIQEFGPDGLQDAVNGMLEMGGITQEDLRDSPLMGYEQERNDALERVRQLQGQ